MSLTREQELQVLVSFHLGRTVTLEAELTQATQIILYCAGAHNKGYKRLAREYLRARFGEEYYLQNLVNQAQEETRS